MSKKNSKDNIHIATARYLIKIGTDKALWLAKRHIDFYLTMKNSDKQNTAKETIPANCDTEKESLNDRVYVLPPGEHMHREVKQSEELKEFLDHPSPFDENQQMKAWATASQASLKEKHRPCVFKLDLSKLSPEERFIRIGNGIYVDLFLPDGTKKTAQQLAEDINKEIESAGLNDSPSSIKASVAAIYPENLTSQVASKKPSKSALDKPQRRACAMCQDLFTAHNKNEKYCHNPCNGRMAYNLKHKPLVVSSGKTEQDGDSLSD